MIKNIIKQMFLKQSDRTSVKEIPGDGFLKIIEPWKEASGFHSYNNSLNSTFSSIYCNGSDVSKIIPPIDNLFSLIKIGNSVGILENFRLDFKFSNSNRRDIIFKIESSTILQIILEENFTVYLIIDNITYIMVEKLLSNDLKAEDIVNKILLKKEINHKKKECDIVIKIENIEDFTAGRFFLPQIVSLKPEVTTTVFTSLRISIDSEWVEQWNGLCYEIKFKILDKEISLYYLFDMITSKNIKQYSDIFSRLLKIVFKSNIKNLKECGITLDKISARIINKPSVDVLNDYIDLKYYLKSPGRIAPGRIIIPNDYIALILHKIAPPWSIFYTEDSLLTKLKSFMALNRELTSQALLPIFDTGNCTMLSETDNPVINLKQNFIKLNNVTDILGKTESSRLISNYFYTKGWSAAMLKRLFYYSNNKYMDEPEEVFPLPLFNEDTFITYLMKNMKDEWIHNKSVKFDNYQKLSNNHYNILKELYREKKLQKSVKLKTVLHESFSAYDSQIDKLFNNIRSDLSYIKYVNQMEIKTLFSNHLAIKKTFYYIPEHLKLFNEILTPDNLTIINNLKVDNPPELDYWLEGFIEFKKKVTMKRTF